MSFKLSLQAIKRPLLKHTHLFTPPASLLPLTLTSCTSSSNFFSTINSLNSPSESTGGGGGYKKPLLGKDLLQSVIDNPSNGNYDTVIVGFTDLYGRLLGKRYSLDYFLKSGYTKSKACSYTFAVDMFMNPLEGFKFASWDTGFGDFKLLPDIKTLRPAAWLPKTLIVLCDVVNEADHDKLIELAPRSMLKNAIKKLNESFGGKKVKINAATELEYYLYNDSYEQAFRKGYRYQEKDPFSSHSLNPAGFYSEDYHILQSTRNESFTLAARNALLRSGVSVETSKGETGIGQHELNVKYDEILDMADAHVVYKQCLKEIAMQQGKSVTFMAKPVHFDAGSSCHIHLSVFDDKSKNLFYKANYPGHDGSNGSSEKVFHDGGVLEHSSSFFQHFLAGWMRHVPELAVFYLPTINSYKRLVKGSWAPTATAWAVENRTAGFRVINDQTKGSYIDANSLRIECRLPGADVNPYLVLAASLASGTQGFIDKMSLPKMLKGDGYSSAAAQEADRIVLPTDLKQATKLFKKSDFVTKVFGPDVKEHYGRFFELECKAFDEFVTDFERQRYFEQI